MASYKAILLLSMIIATNAAPAARTAVALGTAGNFVILAGSGITSTGATAITGDLGLSPAAAAAITGLTLVASADGTYATSSAVTGKVYAADYSSPTPTVLQNAVADSDKAFDSVSALSNPEFSNVGAGNLNGVTLTAGLHDYTTALTFGGTVTMSGSSSDVIIIRTSGTLTFAAGTNIVLAGGIQAKNIFYQTAGGATLAAGAATKGVILSKTGVVFAAGATLTGRALGRTAVTLIGNTIVSP